jgi:hypothetical protein
MAIVRRKMKEALPMIAALAGPRPIASKKKPPAGRVRPPYVMATVSEDQLRRIKQLALDETTTVTQLLLRGLDMVLRSKKLPPL